MGNSTCSIDGCGNEHYAKGWCNLHWTRWRRNGDPLALPGRAVFIRQQCSIEGCTKLAKCRGWRAAHHEHWRRTGDPQTPHRPRQPNREVRTPAAMTRPRWPLTSDECVEWTGRCDRDGYAMVGAGRVHRLAFTALAGWEPEVVRHTCDNPLCYRFEHLLGGTHADNLADRLERGRTRAIIEERERRREWRKRELYQTG